MSGLRFWHALSSHSTSRISLGSILRIRTGTKGFTNPNALYRFHTSRDLRASTSEQEEDDPTEQRLPPSEKIYRLADEVANLTLLEVTDLSSLIKKKLGLPDIPMGMPMMPGMMLGGPMPAAEAASSQAEEKEPEKTAFDVKLEKYEAAAKIKIIKEVRTFTALGLKEAKELVEKTPAVLKKGVSKEEALQILEKIKVAGGTAIME